MGQRIVYIDIIHIKCVLGQLELAEFQHFRAVDDRMHEDVLVQPEASDIVPAENLVFRKDIVVADDFLVFHADFFIHIVCDDHIHLCIGFHESFHCFEYFEQGVFIDPVVAVHDFEVNACGVPQPPVHGVSVTAVLLADRLYDGRIFLLVALGYRLCPVGRAVVDNDDFHVFAAFEYGVDGLFHICF